MTRPEFNLNHAQFAQLFPFHFLLDANMCVIDTGAVLERLCPHIAVGDDIHKHFTYFRQALVPMTRITPEYIKNQLHTMFIFKSTTSDLMLRFQAMALPNPERYLFLGSPWIRNSSELKNLHLVLHDFAVHDSTVDLLHVIQTTNLSLQEIKKLSEDRARAYRELQDAYDATLKGWVRALDLRDNETADHSRRVTLLTVELARLMGMSDSELIHVQRGALLHDIGKIAVSDQILQKPGPLSENEWVIMRKHPQHAHDMLAPIEYLRPALDIPFCHHERWDGTGYPRQLKGEHIPLAARIFAVIDVFDALSSDRPYRKAWPNEKIIEHIREQSGKHFDPKAVELFLPMMAGAHA